MENVISLNLQSTIDVNVTSAKDVELNKSRKTSEKSVQLNYSSSTSVKDVKLDQHFGNIVRVR